MKALLADLSSTVWEPEQRRWLREKFQTIADGLRDALVFQGRRVVSSGIALVSINGASGFKVECDFKPASVLMLSFVDGTTTYTQVPMAWSWDGTDVSLWDYTGLLDGPLSGGLYTATVFIERA